MYFLSCFNVYKMKNRIFWDVMLHRMLNTYRRFVGSLCFRVQGRVQEGCGVRASLLGMKWRDCAAQSGNSAYRSTASRHVSSTRHEWRGEIVSKTAERTVIATDHLDYCWQPSPAFVWLDGLDATVPRASVTFKNKQCDTTQSFRAAFIFKIVEVHGRFRRKKNVKNIVRCGLIGF